MKKFQDSKILYNPFRMYRYEIVGAYVDYIFTDEDVETRQSMDDDGYDDVTELEKFGKFSSEIKQRYLPFLWEITENDFIQDFNKLSYDEQNIAWDKSINNIIKPKIKEILNQYDFKLNDDGIKYGQGDLLIEFSTPYDELLKFSKSNFKIVSDKFIKK